MAATVTIRRWTGSPGSPTKTDVTSANSRHTVDDTYTASGTTNPIPIPSSGTNYGFWQSLRLSVDVAPAGTINNLLVYTDGSSGLPTGVAAMGQEANVGANAGYRQATGSSSVAPYGDVLNTTNHTGLTGAPVDIFTWTSGSPKSLSGTITTATGDLGSFVVYQIQVPSTVGITGASSAETLTFLYDET